jgi:hypothetical protein
MNQPIEAAMAQLRHEIETRAAALAALERIASPPAPVIEARALPAPKPRAAKKPAQIDLEDAIAATAEKPAARKSKVDPEKLRTLHDKGLDDGQIGAELGVTASGVLQWRRKLGLAANSRGGRKAAPSSAPGIERVNSATTIVAWLRQRDTIIVDADPGKTWKVNGRDIIDRAGLLTMANRKREIAKLPPFAFENG